MTEISVCCLLLTFFASLVQSISLVGGLIGHERNVQPSVSIIVVLSPDASMYTRRLPCNVIADILDRNKAVAFHVDHFVNARVAKY
jgi:hypothetical protein